MGRFGLLNHFHPEFISSKPWLICKAISLRHLYSLLIKYCLQRLVYQLGAILKTLCLLTALDCMSESSLRHVKMLPVTPI